MLIILAFVLSIAVKAITRGVEAKQNMKESVFKRYITDHNQYKFTIKTIIVFRYNVCNNYNIHSNTINFISLIYNI